MRGKLGAIRITVLLLLLFILPHGVLAADKTKPIISGATNKTIYTGSSFNAKSGVTAKDNVDGNITNKINISGKVNTKKVGVYKVTYTVSDKAKNKTSKVRKITVKKDNVKPKIKGASSKTVYIGSSFNAKTGVSASDNADGNITKKIKITGKVNTKKSGKYKVTYSVSDKAKNKATVTRFITVKKDTVKPKITGASNKTIYIGSAFNPKTGVKATDNVDGNLTKAIKVSGKVNLKKAGKYKLTYSVSDKAKNSFSVSRVITVKKDSVKPVISGISNKSVNIGTPFNPKIGITAADNIDGNLTQKININGVVDVNRVGEYTITYSVKDSSGNIATANRIITVKDLVKPVISGVTDITIHTGETFSPLEGVKATDNVDGDLTAGIEVKGTVDVNTPGSYTLTYSVTDKVGNITIAKRTITVTDNIKPVITGADDVTIDFGGLFDLMEGVSAADNVDGDLTSRIIVSGDVNSEVPGTYLVTYTVTDLSGNTASMQRNISVKEAPLTLLELNKPYTSPDNNMTVLVTEIAVEDLGGYYQYSIYYTQSNKTGDQVIEEGSFKVYYSDGTSQPQYGFFDKLYPTDTVDRVFTFKALKSLSPLCIEYAEDNFFSTKPLHNSLKWEVK